jgi:hypothetical protein
VKVKAPAETKGGAQPFFFPGGTKR